MSGGRSSRDKGMVAHKRIVSECALHIGDPSLSKEDVLTGRRWARFIGKPWEDGAEDLHRIHRQLTTQEQEQCLLPSPT